MMGEMDLDMNNIAVLSIGTGTAIKDLRVGTLKSRGRGWGMLEWILPNQGNIVTTIMDGSSEASQAIVEVFFKVRGGGCEGGLHPEAAMCFFVMKYAWPSVSSCKITSVATCRWHEACNMTACCCCGCCS